MNLIYDWNQQGEAFPTTSAELVDHTLADRPAHPEVLEGLAAVGVRRVVVRPEDEELAVRHGLRPERPALLPLSSPAALVASIAGDVVLHDREGRLLRAGVRQVVTFARQLGRGKVEWLGGNQRGLALSNALEAWRSGVDAVHGSVFGLGPDAGWLASELWLVNQKLYGVLPDDLSALKRLCEAVSRHCGVPIHPNRPVVGADAFRTGTGVHAAAIIKAYAKGDDWLADLVYSGVPASQFGLRQIIEVGPMAGASNVQHWLRQHGHEPDPDSVQRILALAKTSDRVLSDEEILGVLTNTAR